MTKIVKVVYSILNKCYEIDIEINFSTNNTMTFDINYIIDRVVLEILCKKCSISVTPSNSMYVQMLKDTLFNNIKIIKIEYK